ncbi:hypothetical protein Desti_4649 [Desulfomonile tiedjei DSM 6799]|uniref:Uncharacterized protein n=1 Tax=Desulfomonile tiedjei (strain ATCC 49306 / DSM 6799 / DCB-1) TaxID=706587 RepID=I4CCI1_DESTA|nr:hypothetical protein Desti_4649 [Desulfomonile tiedjei DSM 6799]
MPPCRHMFNIINDIKKMGPREETVSIFSNAQQIVPRFDIFVGVGLVFTLYLGTHEGRPYNQAVRMMRTSCHDLE